MFKKLAYHLALLVSALSFNVIVQAEGRDCSGVQCDISIIEPAALNMPCGGGEQHLFYTLTNHTPITVNIKNKLETIAGNTSSSNVSISGGTCGNGAASFNLGAGKSCTVEVTVISEACGGGPLDKTAQALPQVKRALTFTPNTRQLPLRETFALDITSANSQRAYIANRVALLGDDEISRCPVNTDGSLAACTQIPHSTFSIPVDVVLNNDSTVAYIANSGNSTISVCDVNPTTGVLGTCDVFAPGGSLTYTGLRLNAHNTHLYISLYFSDKVLICPIDADGGLSQACESPQGGDGPNGRMVFNMAGTLAYIADYNANRILICNPALLDCDAHSDSNSTFSGLLGMDINVSGSYVYVANYNGGTGRISVCKMTGDTLAPCSSTTGNGTFSFTDAVINPYMHNFNRYGYVPNNSNDTISVCPVSPTTGVIGMCVASPGTFNNPTSVWIATLHI